MKTFLSLLSLAGLLITTGCTVEEHRGGYYGPHEHGNASFYYHHDHDDYHGGYWDRGHYYRD